MTSFANLRKTDIHYDDEAVENMLLLLKHGKLPEHPPVGSSSPWSLGIDLDYLKSMKHKFETEWSWKKLEERINSLDHYLVDVTTKDDDKFQMHFIHQRSSRADAIPLMLLHGWPGSFYDYIKVIEPLTNPPSADLPAFHVIIPSLPGYFQSTLPPRDGFNLADIARVYNAFMVDLLKYNLYAIQANDWGSMIARIMSNRYSESVVSIHFNFLLVCPPANADPSTYTVVEKSILAGLERFSKWGSSYFTMQATKPWTIGYAIGASPLAMLSYIGEKMHDWSDPRRIQQEDIIDNVALYFLSGTFASSSIMYNQAFKSRDNDGSSQLDSLTLPINARAFGFSAFPYEVGGGPRVYMEPLGNLTFYREHPEGGHFPALDSPQEFLEDVRAFFGENYYRFTVRVLSAAEREAQVYKVTQPANEKLPFFGYFALA